MPRGQEAFRCAATRSPPTAVHRPRHARARRLPALPDDRRVRRSRSWRGAGTRGSTSPPRPRGGHRALADIANRSASCSTTGGPSSSARRPTTASGGGTPGGVAPAPAGRGAPGRILLDAQRRDMAIIGRRRSSWYGGMVAVAQLVEHRVVVPGVAGSNPVSHPGEHERGPRQDCRGPRSAFGRQMLALPARH